MLATCNNQKIIHTNTIKCFALSHNTYIGIGIGLFYGLGSIGALMACLSVKNVMLLTKKNVGFMA